VKKGLYVVAAVALLGIAGALMYQALNSSLVYFIIPSEYAAHPSQYESRRIRLGGIVEPNSVKYDNQNLQLVFKITDSIDSYTVQHVGAPPELFKENTGVVVEGKFVEGTFHSDELLIKHTEVYEPPKPGQPIDLDNLKDTLQ
jgi:cytochrome c-type biogenesis protein CcmE